VSFQVKVRPQVWVFATTLGLEHRRAFKRAVTRLATEKGDIRALGDKLSGYYRLKVARYRVIFRYTPGQVIECVFAEERKLVYEIFESEMNRILQDKSPRPPAGEQRS
jgi:mRNA interferase RelE/StbE